MIRNKHRNNQIQIICSHIFENFDIKKIYFATKYANYKLSGVHTRIFLEFIKKIKVHEFQGVDKNLNVFSNGIHAIFDK